MKKVNVLIVLLLVWGGGVVAQTSSAPEEEELILAAKKSLAKGIHFFQSLAIEGGYVYHYTVDGKEKWGEGKTDDRTIEVQPPGTPAVGMSFLRAFRVTGDPAFLSAAERAVEALIMGQNELGGWDHKIYFDRPKGNKVSFDDNQTQSAISFLMSLDQEIDRPDLTAAVEKALEMMITTQLKNGGWPHKYPEQGNYHDYATFNDQGINDCIRVMIEANTYYDHPAYRESLDKVGRFMMISQLPPPQPGWAQQYNEFLQPAWARSFEPPAACPAATIHNLHSLIDLYGHTGSRTYLEPIPDAIRWLKASRLPNGKWGRFLELGTNKALYYDRGRIRVDSLHQLSLERQTGYGYEQDLSVPLQQVEARFLSASKNRSEQKPESINEELLRESVRKIISTQDEQGRWITPNDRFRQEIAVTEWNGEYRIEDRVSSGLFNDHVNTLCAFLERYSSKSWSRHTIDASSTGADGVKLADINQDGRLDITTGWEEGGITKLYLHPGLADVKKIWPSVIVGKTPNVEDAVFMDINDDGRLDVVSCTEKNSEQILIHLAPKRKMLTAQKWKQKVLPASDGLMMWMYAEPLQVDGRYGIDLLAAGKGENAQLGWFAAPARAAQFDQWEWHSITPVGWIMSMILRDMDADGDLDIVITDRYGDLRGCRWLENPTDRTAQQKAWASHWIGAKDLEVMFMTMADLDADGQEEAVVAERTDQTIRIYKLLDQGGLNWQEQIINLPTFTGFAKSVEVGDLNGDGTNDLIISTNTNGQEKSGLIWLDGQKIKQAKAADFQSISGVHNAKYDKVELLDIDDDGDLDILICEENYGENSEGLGIIWYENRLGMEDKMK